MKIKFIISEILYGIGLLFFLPILIGKFILDLLNIFTEWMKK